MDKELELLKLKLEFLDKQMARVMEEAATHNSGVRGFVSECLVRLQDLIKSV
ncbi:MAG: hypothetical protein KGI54_10560 [Pseudomonadota bacterium]|nr:hypothetical protein [Pseudomonadota bacterium]